MYIDISCSSWCALMKWILLYFNPHWIVENSQDTKLLLNHAQDVLVIKDKTRKIIWFILFYNLLVHNEGKDKKKLIK